MMRSYDDICYSPSVDVFRALILSQHRRLRTISRRIKGVDWISASSLADVRERLKTSPVDLAVFDLADGGLEPVRFLRSAYPEVSILAVTDVHLREDDVEAIKLGVDGFVVEPFRSEHLQFQISKVREMRRLREEYLRLSEGRSEFPGRGELIGISQPIREVFRLISAAAETSVPVALYGESGTGKELVARAIHHASPRRHGPFICINPSAVPANLLESELFGHVKGAFTGATSDRVGFIEESRGGTLFLDEIGDLPGALQGKLLRVLQEKMLHRVGSTRPVPVDFRLITATHRDIKREIQEGRFREDLYYRIHVFPIELPPLRSRRVDIPLLADHFLRKYARETGRALTGVSADAIERLLGYSWPGNVRELENVVHRAVAMKTHGTHIESSDLSRLVPVLETAPATGGDFPASIKPLDEHVRDYVRWVYRTLGQNKARAARLLEIDRVTLYRKLKT